MPSQASGVRAPNRVPVSALPEAQRSSVVPKAQRGAPSVLMSGGCFGEQRGVGANFEPVAAVRGLDVVDLPPC